MKNFDPREHASFSELPEEQKSNFQELDGGSFVRKSVEHNPELAQKLADIVDRTVGPLKEKLNTIGISEDEARSLKTNAWGTGDQLSENKYEQILLAYKDARTFLSEGFVIKKDSYEPYSEIAQNILFDLINPQDIDVVNAVMVNRRFTKRSDLISLMDNASIQKLYETAITNNNDEVVAAIISGTQDKDFIIKVLRELSVTRDLRKSKIISTENILKAISSQLLKNGYQNEFFELCDEGLLGPEYAYLQEQSNDVLYKLAVRFKPLPWDHLNNPLCYIGDPAIFAKIIDTKGADFENVIKNKDHLIEFAESRRVALESDPKIVQVGKSLEKVNKFIVNLKTPLAIDTVTKKRVIDPVKGGWLEDIAATRFRIVWGGMRSGGGRHKDLFEKISSGEQIEGDTVGGYMNIEQTDDKAIIVFSGTSGDFGPYSNNILEHYRPQLEETLCTSLGKEVEVQINFAKRPNR